MADAQVYYHISPNVANFVVSQIPRVNNEFGFYLSQL